MPHRVALLSPRLAGLQAYLPKELELVTVEPGTSTREDLTALLAIGGAAMPETLFETLPKLRFIQAFGAGYDGIDVPAMNARGVMVANCPNVNNEDVADSAVGIFVALVRDIVAGHGRVVSGAWERGERDSIRPSLRQLKAGIVGMGAIGQSIAKRLPGFGMEVMWWGPNEKPSIPYPRVATLKLLAEQTDALFVAVRADETSRGLISAEIIEAIGPRGYLVNVSRGFTVDEDALIAALKAKKIGGAALDVFVEEPTPAARWAGVPNVVLSPHMAGGGRGALEAQTRLVIENLMLFFAGKPVKTPVA